MLKQRGGQKAGRDRRLRPFLVAGTALALSLILTQSMYVLWNEQATEKETPRSEVRAPIVRNGENTVRGDVVPLRLYEAQPWLVGSVRHHVKGLERSLSPYGYTSVRERVELAPDRDMAFPLLVENPDLVGYQSRSRGEALDAWGYPLRWQKSAQALQAMEDAQKMHARTKTARPSTPFYYVRRARGLGFRGPVLAYLPLVRRYAARYKIPVHLLLAVIQVESGGRHDATSASNAVGLMQVQPHTAGLDVHRYLARKERLGVLGRSGEQSADQSGESAGAQVGNEVPLSIDSSQVHMLLADIEQNILYGASYLHLLDRTYFRRVSDREARMLCVLAAYNMGPGRFTRLFAQTPDEAIRVINLYSRVGLYEEIKSRYAGKSYSYLDRTISLMLQYRKMGY